MADWIEIALRTLVTIAVLFLFARIVGKRQITQLTYFEYITGITIGSIAAFISIERSEHWWLGVVALGVWTLVSLALEFISIKSKRARDTVEGKGTVLIKEGKILEDNLKKVRYNSDELLAQLRQKNVFQMADVEFAVLETSGSLSILLKKDKQPLTPSSLGIKIAPEQEPQTVIMDGNIMDEPLATLGLSRSWLLTEIDKLGVTLDNIFIGQVDSYGQLYVDLFDDQIQIPAPQQKAQLFATLKKCEADLEMFSLSTRDEQAKLLYASCAQLLEQTIHDMRPYLTR